MKALHYPESTSFPPELKNFTSPALADSGEAAFSFFFPFSTTSVDKVKQVVCVFFIVILTGY